MERQIFVGDRPEKNLRSREYWVEWLWILGLFLAALVLFGTNLNNLPLQDGDEGMIAQVAKEIHLAPQGSRQWLFPTLWKIPYLHNPPLIQSLIAILYSWFGVDEWTTRLPTALLTAISVPFVYSIGREIFSNRIPGIFAALIYLTFLPVICYGRLAILEGPLLCFETLTILCILRSRRDLRWTLLAGVGFGLMFLVQKTEGLLIGAIILVFLAWDTPRLLSSLYLWLGLLLGSMPLIFWYVAQSLHYGLPLISKIAIGQYFQATWQNLATHNTYPLYHLGEILKYSWPWLFFSLYGLKQAWIDRTWGWAKLVLVWTIFYFVAASFFLSATPGNILPIYPSLALAGGAQLAQIYTLPSFSVYPRSWTVIFGLLALLSGSASIYFGITYSADSSLVIIFASLALTFGVVAILIERQDRQFMTMLFWGMYISLLLLVLSPHWIGQLNNIYPVEKLARVIKSSVPTNQLIYTSSEFSSALNFYSDHQIIALSPSKQDELRISWLERHWKKAPESSPQEIKHYWLKQHWNLVPRPYLL
ncbi:MAG: glycosyltransferase family 39 protein, partial [Spirulinaceae cyanobacterium]